MSVVLAVLLLVAQDPAEQLRRQELALRLEDLARDGKLDAFSRAVLRELRGRRVDAASLELCWKLAALRRWEGGLPDFVAAWDKAAAAETPAPAQALFRARLEALASKPAASREQLEAAAKKFPGEPAILWFVARARAEAAEHRGTAAALEEMASLSGYPYDGDEFHRMLALSYAETERRTAALEHLRAVREDRADALDLATLATKCRLPEEAARYFRLAAASDPGRLSIRMGLIRSLQAAGAEEEARVERRSLFTVDGELSVSRVEDYFFLLPPEGRVDEIHRTLVQTLPVAQTPEASKVFDAVAAKVPGDERSRVSDAWEASAREPRDWLMLARVKRNWVAGFQPALDSIEKGETKFPQDVGLVREKLDLMERLYRPKGVSAAFLRLAELDPEKRTGPRPYPSAQRAIRQLAQVDAAEAIRLGVFILSEPGLEEATLLETRAAMKPACEASGAAFWEEVRKLKLPSAGAKTGEAIRAQVSKLSDDEFEVRSAAARELKKIGLPAIPALLEHIDSSDVEVRSKAREIIRGILSE
ncbi:MAG TPA: HEAT repeat domain-containing protein [Planctomycetota bacterium]|nr:HEAT repeat domain-containing protein [Planctomycetota bacterium]